MQPASPEEAKSHLAELIDAAMRDDRHAVQLVPVSPANQSRQAGNARGLIVMREDFDAPLDDFSEYIQ